ncbi:MAG: 2-phosphosulfolactate phosphatase [Brevefilum sp.]|nr:2-phosphosulfolactate phosphatase [Brevefilum sp.]
MTDFKYYTLDNAHQAFGSVIVLDVLRAFTTAAHAFDRGAETIFPVASVEGAIQLRKRIRGSLIMGEVDGIKPVEFDFGNSPDEIRGLDLSGRTLIQRTSAGTQGIMRAVYADRLFAASFVVAKATALQIQQINPEAVSFIVTGESMGRDGDEDRACGEYIQSLIIGEGHDPGIFTQRVATSSVGRFFKLSQNPYISEKDFDLSIEADRFSFSLPVEREQDLWVMRAEKPIS